MGRGSEDYEWGYRDGYVAGRWAERDNLPLTRGSAPIPSGPKPKKKRKPSAYNKKYAAAYKRLKKKHPRMSFAALAKKAHRMVKKK